MISSRRYHRIDLSSKATVHYRDNCFEGVIGAISLGGAAINFTGCAMIPENDECVISVGLDETKPLLQLNARITNSSVSRIGVAFINMDNVTKHLLYSSLKKLSQEPESLGKEFNLIIALS